MCGYFFLNSVLPTLGGFAQRQFGVKICSYSNIQDSKFQSPFQFQTKVDNTVVFSWLYLFSIRLTGSIFEALGF